MTSYQPQPAGVAGTATPPLEMPYYGIGFVDAIKRGFKKYATFSGRASRSEYWWWYLFTFLVYLVLGVPLYVVGIATSRDGGRTPGTLAIPLIILLTVFALGIIVPSLALTVRRLHDAGYSGLLALLLLIPYVGRVGHSDLRLPAELAGRSQVRPGSGNFAWIPSLSATAPIQRLKL